MLEVGTFSGYSAICIAEGLPDDGKLYTFEINDEMEDFTRPWIEGCEVANKIDFRIGDANIEAPKFRHYFRYGFRRRRQTNLFGNLRNRVKNVAFWRLYSCR